jgi:hypothetical protein
MLSSAYLRALRSEGKTTATLAYHQYALAKFERWLGNPGSIPVPAK